MRLRKCIEKLQIGKDCVHFDKIADIQNDKRKEKQN